ncbi:8585_t:CDS:2, partial [Funneliformis geosporum]
DDAKKFLNDYGLEKGFSIHRKCTDTSVEGDQHNHLMVPSPTTTIEKYRKLNNNMIQFIEFCVKHGMINTKNHLMTIVKFDASDLMRHLYSKRAEDPQWFIEAKFNGLTEWQLYGLLWLLPEQ